jgi:hypothetical protein
MNCSADSTVWKMWGVAAGHKVGRDVNLLRRHSGTHRTVGLQPRCGTRTAAWTKLLVLAEGLVWSTPVPESAHSATGVSTGRHARCGRDGVLPFNMLVGSEAVVEVV